jgi:ParB family chromosome partitioning protein
MTRGLGRGLDALLGSYSEDVGAPEVMLLPTAVIRSNPNQPRKEFDEEALNELAASIRASGLLQPVLVRPARDSDEHEYELVAGERRLRASKLAELDEIPAIVRDISDEESMAVALVENLQREDLNAMEEAQGLHQLQRQFGLSQEELAEKIGKSRPAVANTLRLLNLPQEIQGDIRSGQLAAGHGRALLAIDDNDARLRLRQRILNEDMSVREVEAAVSYFKRVGALPGESAPKQARGKKAKRLPASMTRLEDELNRSLDFKIRLSGNSGKGKITFSYADKDQLLNLLAVFGMREDAQTLLESEE